MVDYSYKEYIAKCEERGWEPHSHFAKEWLALAKEESMRMMANRKTIEEYYKVHLTKSNEETLYTLSPKQYETLTRAARGTEVYTVKVLEAIEDCDREEREANARRIDYMKKAMQATEFYNNDASWRAKDDFLEREVKNRKLLNRN